MQAIRRKLRYQEFDELVIEIMTASRRPSTIKQYSPHTLAWDNYCKEQLIHPVFTNIQIILKFLRELFNRGSSHSSISMAKSAIQAITILPPGQCLSKMDTLKMFTQGVFNKRPPQNKTPTIWDADEVVVWMDSLGSPDVVALDILVTRLLLLVLLLSGQRPQVLLALKLSNLILTKSQAVFTLQSLDFKQGRPGFKVPKIVLPAYPRSNVCIVAHLIEYLQRTESVRDSIDELILTTRKPFHPASLNTMSRWIKLGLEKAGININVYGAGSTRSASASKALQGGASIDSIIKMVGWSKQTTFTRFYSKQIKVSDNIAQYILPAWHMDD